MSPMQNRLMVPQKTPLLLDLAPGAAAAYSLRQLSNSYTGPVVTVRRSTDNEEADFTANEIDNGDLAAWCMGGDGFVKQWWDQSGSNHCTQTTAGYQPKIASAGVVILEGGKPALSFDGTNDWLSVPSSKATFKFLHDGTKSAIFCVSRFGVSSDPGVLYSLLGSTGASSASVGFYVGYNDIPAANNRLAVSVGRGTAGLSVFNAVANGNLTPARQTMLSLLFDAASATPTERVRLHVDAAFVVNGNTDSNPPSTGNATYDMQIGSSGTSSFSLLGTISEVIIYPRDMTAERQLIEGSMAWYF